MTDKISKETLIELFNFLAEDYGNINNLVEKHIEEGKVFYVLMNDGSYVMIMAEISARFILKNRFKYSITYKEEEYTFQVTEYEFMKLRDRFHESVDGLDMYRRNKQAEEIINKINNYKEGGE